MVTKGTTKPYVHFIGNSSIDVTGSCHHLRFQKYSILLDCGLIQSGDIMTTYKANREQLKKIKVKEIDWIILTHVHIDHSSLIPALYAKGCQAHVIVPKGSLPFLKLLWEDSMKINQSDCEKLIKKHGMKASPYYEAKDIERALDRCIEVDFDQPYSLCPQINLTFLHAGHIVNAAQVYLELKDGYITKRVGYTGDIGGSPAWHRMFTDDRETLKFVDLLIGEATYNSPARPNQSYDRDKDIEKIVDVVRDSQKTLFPIFSLHRCQELLVELYKLWDEGKLPSDIPVYIDSPLASKICHIWPYNLDTIEGKYWDCIMHDWNNLHFIGEYDESVSLQSSNEKCIILAASGFLVGGRIMGHLKTLLPNPNNTILFVGYSGENNLASQIKCGQKEVNVDGMLVANKANIIDLHSFSSHANWYELMDYYRQDCLYNKICLVHSEFQGKVDFANKLQQDLIEQGKSARVVAVNQDSKVYL